MSAGFEMMTPVTRQFLRDFYEARLSGDPEDVAPFLDDNVRWSISGPINPLQFCGERRGKQAVLTTLAYGAKMIELTAIDIDEILIDGDRAATFTRFIGRHRSSGRTISYNCAQLMRFQNGKLIDFRALIDSFDAAEQVLGHAIDVSQTGAPSDFAASGDFIAL